MTAASEAKETTPDAMDPDDATNNTAANPSNTESDAVTRSGNADASTTQPTPETSGDMSAAVIARDGKARPNCLEQPKEPINAQRDAVLYRLNFAFAILMLPKQPDIDAVGTVYGFILGCCGYKAMSRAERAMKTRCLTSIPPRLHKLLAKIVATSKRRTTEKLKKSDARELLMEAASIWEVTDEDKAEALRHLVDGPFKGL